MRYDVCQKDVDEVHVQSRLQLLGLVEEYNIIVTSKIPVSLQRYLLS